MERGMDLARAGVVASLAGKWKGRRKEEGGRRKEEGGRGECRNVGMWEGGNVGICSRDACRGHTQCV